MKVINRKIVEITGKMVELRAVKMVGNGFIIKIRGDLHGSKRIEQVRKFRTETERLINN